MRFQIQIEGCDDRFSCSEEQTVLRSTEIGIKRRIPVGARVMSRAHVTREDRLRKSSALVCRSACWMVID